LPTVGFRSTRSDCKSAVSLPPLILLTGPAETSDFCNWRECTPSILILFTGFRESAAGRLILIFTLHPYISCRKSALFTRSPVLKLPSPCFVVDRGSQNLLHSLILSHHFCCRVSVQDRFRWTTESVVLIDSEPDCPYRVAL